MSSDLGLTSIGWINRLKNDTENHPKFESTAVLVKSCLKR